jgi:hypothetical protein
MRNEVALRSTPLLIIAIAVAVAVSGCGGGGGSPSPGTSTCSTDSRGETYLPGMSQIGQDHLLTVKLMSSNPGPPIKGNNDWVIAVVDANGLPVDGLAINVVPFMPDHGHGTPIKVAVTPMGHGTYQLSPVNLFMAGLWQVTINMTTADMKVDQSVFSFCIEG